MAKKSDDEIRSLLTERLYVAAICDILDVVGFRHQAMHHRLRPVHDRCTFAGRARTLVWKYEYGEREGVDPYDIEIAAMDALRPGDVVVHNTDPAMRNAPWGELMSTAARMRGAVGAVVDSNVRDVRKIADMGFPVFAAGIRPLDSKGRGKVVEYDAPIECGDVAVRPGEWVFGDYDGVVVIPRDVEDEVVAKAGEKVHSENLTRQALLDGKLLGEVYAKYGVL